MRALAPASFVAIAACAIVACTNGGGLGSIGGGGGTPSPLPSAAIGVGIPTGKIGVETDPIWGTVSGYTQSQTSQVMAYSPGVTVTVQNLSTTTPHTLNVIGQTKGPPANFPQNPSLSFYPSKNDILSDGYSSGTLAPGASVKVKLTKPGIYLIGCAYHYIEYAMRDVIEVVAGATPGPTASPGPGGYAKTAASPSLPLAAARAPHLIDQTGRSFALESLRGQPLVVTFVAAHCTDACPLIDGQFAQLADAIAQSRLSARLLTISLDPEHDSPATMAALAKRFSANPRYWRLASGRVADVHEIMRAFGVLSVEGKRGYRDEHTTFVYVFDANGKLAETMLASTALRDDVLSGLRDGRWGSHA